MSRRPNPEADENRKVNSKPSVVSQGGAGRYFEDIEARRAAVAAHKARKPEVHGPDVLAAETIDGVGQHQRAQNSQSTRSNPFK